MSPPAFWSTRGPAALALAPVGALLGLVTGLRMRTPGTRADVPVLCVGNFTVGGAGKTPTVIALVAALRAQGERPVVLTRGYGGTVRGPHRLDLTRDTAESVGDEAMLIAATGTDVVVGADRAAGARLGATLGATVLVMDDGFQNPGLAKDLSLVVVDGASGVGNGLPGPAGPLRAPLALQWPHVGALVVIGAGAPGDRLAEQAAALGRPVHRGRLVPDPAAAALAGARVLAFCGIGRPEKFRATLREVGADVVQFRAFPDHHVVTHPEASALIAAAMADNLTLVTTRKDHVRLMAHPATRGTLAGLTNVVDVALSLDDPAALTALVDRALDQGRRSSR